MILNKFFKTKDILYNNKIVDNDFRYCKDIVYIVKNKEGKIYIGETSTTFIERIKHHLRKNNTDFGAAINRNNMNNFEWAILENNLDDINQRYNREKYFIKKYNSFEEGFNMTQGGGGTKALKHSQESIEKNRLSKLKHFKKSENRKKQSKASLLANIINPSQALEHSKLMKKKFDINTKEGLKRRKLTSQKQREYYNENKIKYILNYKKPPFLAYKDGKCIGFFLSLAECARMLNVRSSHLSRVLNGKRKTTGGYEFRYIDKAGYLLKDL